MFTKIVAQGWAEQCLWDPRTTNTAQYDVGLWLERIKFCFVFASSYGDNKESTFTFFSANDEKMANLARKCRHRA